MADAAGNQGGIGHFFFWFLFRENQIYTYYGYTKVINGVILHSGKVLVDMNRYRTIQWIESIVFFAAANLIMLAGADFPPPAGFAWSSLAAGILSVLQFFYTGWLLQKIGDRKTFGITVLIFFLAGIGTAIFFTLFSSETVHGGSFLIWLLVVGIVFAGYGCIYWLLNRVIRRRLE